MRALLFLGYAMFSMAVTGKNAVTVAVEKANEMPWIGQKASAQFGLPFAKVR
jgi:hypothetical protein